MRALKLHSTALALIAMTATGALAADTYGPFPVTLQGYAGDKTDSVSYSGQIARHALHDSLKKAAALATVAPTRPKLRPCCCPTSTAPRMTSTFWLRPPKTASRSNKAP